MIVNPVEGVGRAVRRVRDAGNRKCGSRGAAPFSSDQEIAGGARALNADAVAPVAGSFADGRLDGKAEGSGSSGAPAPVIGAGLPSPPRASLAPFVSEAKSSCFETKGTERCLMAPSSSAVDRGATAPDD